MAIRMMVSEKRAGEPGVERVDDYPGRRGRPLFMATSYEGAVLATGERNFHDDSDFYAVVWDEAEGRVRQVEYATTRGWTYPNSATVDATPEVQEKAARWLAAGRVRDAVRQARIVANETLAAGTEPGELVEVFKGRKVPKGTVGRVFWVGRSDYGGFRVGIETADGERHFTAETNLRSLEMRRRRDVAGRRVRERSALAHAGSRTALAELIAKTIMREQSWRGATFVPQPGMAFVG